MSQNSLKSLIAKVLLALPTILLTPSTLLAENCQPKISLSIDNYDNSNLVQLYISPAGSNAQGNEKLQGRVLKPGETADIAIYNKPGECVYDIKAVFADGKENVERQANLCDIDGGSYSLYGDDDRVFKVSNRTNNNMVEFYWRNSGQDKWGEDLLGSASIGARQTVFIPVDSNKCLYEFRAVFTNGQILDLQQNVCQNNNSVVSDVIFGR
ncbi:MAG TPA: hypothetical protein DEG17_16485 [Cyanobacteria bacterium UBA11149]|nr:hypothetical protein [Cyanobacteria bacterium UBA11367]HBE59573.1 hypothetical protein [Cyanobacteria bacterium UBA11366]HBK62604.1 hypothetical protein [Cyanobacteria bacterium UBA11166]HBR73133.1 hypothetical protein [Cyanobacteria bacterium UBA11159]HBS71094.1 hypothetical protein [Cyanobacteria bacterium UBA11153]HBW90421.1 hypothetical protein [Cyanobacteria bacterium UBA11149]HCA95215.1 hypothetical protein [Cyanobacteria bacterium UBA9226]